MLKFSRLISLIIFSTLVISSQNSLSKEVVIPDPFNLEIFSLSKKKENAFDSASSIYVLTTEDIRRSGATSIPEALRMVPGLQVARIAGHSWAISSRGFNRQYSNKLLVMIDGRTVYTPLFSGTWWDVQDYLLEDIEKIEVIRGSGGTIWGTNAVNGIINIITKNAANTTGAYASTIVGTEDKAIMEVRYGGKTDSNDHYRLYAKQVNRDDLTKFDNNGGHFSNNDGYKNSQSGFRYDVRSITNNKISVHGDIRQGESKNYMQLAALSNAPNHRDTKGANIGTNWDKTFSRKSSISLNTYVDYDQFDINGILNRTSKTLDVDFQHFYDFSRENQFIWGLGYRQITDSIKEFSLNNGIKVLKYDPPKRNDEILSAFIQDKIGIIPDKLYLTLGTKFEYNDFTGSEFQPNAKLTLFPTRNQTIWTSISQAVRTPTRGEDGITITAPTSSTTILNSGNHGYESEKVLAYELGYRIKPLRTLLFDVATFYNDYSKLRTFDYTNKVANNFANGHSFGAEASVKWQVTNDWLLEAGYDFLRMELEVNSASTDSVDLANKEGQSPNNQFRLRSNYNITRNIEFDNIVYYVDSLPDSGASTTANGVPSYVRFDTRIGYLPTENWELSVVGQNLTDHRHQEFDKGLAGNKVEVGRSFYFKAVWQY